MIAIDTNILVYAHRKDSSFHDKADSIIAKLWEGNLNWCIPFPCLYEFFSVVTNQKIFKVPSPPEIALKQIDTWLEATSLLLLREDMENWSIARELILQSRIAGAMIHDARIYSICKSNGVSIIYSADRDLSRFKGVAVKNPLLD